MEQIMGVVSLVISSLLGIIGFLGGLIMKQMHNRIMEIEEDQKQFPNIYARRDDVRDMKQEIVDVLRRIEDKVDKRYEQN